ncbi:MAG: hypothetical protein KF864_15505 [Phycisphaeraceae bacterium]|nr:hypothetical protein [Phycisphaeraceae bacterium]
MMLARDIPKPEEPKPDAFGRLTTVKTRGGSPATVSEYRYNGLGHRIGWRSDTNFDSTVDGSDPWYWFVYDDRWRVVATYRGSDAHPKERFIHHNAGVGGFGGSSYIDSVILRDSDDPEGWTNAADGTLETRHYYLQNWRHDVVALIEPDGTPFEYIRYSAYGVPTVYAAGDVNRDGVCDGYDPQDWDDYNDYGVGALAVDLDVNRDGVVDSADRALVQGHADWLLWTNHGRGSVSRLHNRRGYAGYEYDPATQQWHVRHRVLVSEMGRWNRRDPLGYVDGMSVYEYVGSRAVVAVDPSGLVSYLCSYKWVDVEYELYPTWIIGRYPSLPGQHTALVYRTIELEECCRYPFLEELVCTRIQRKKLKKRFSFDGQRGPMYRFEWRDSPWADYGCVHGCWVEMLPNWGFIDGCRLGGALCSTIPGRVRNTVPTYPTYIPPVAPAVGPR